MLNRSRRTLPDGNWAAIQKAFNWSIPKNFSIAQTCCDDWAIASPDRTAIIELGSDRAKTVWSFGQLKSSSDRLALALRAEGITKGDRVAILLSQSPEVMISHFGVMKLGAISLPLFTLFGEDALSFRLADSGARVAITDDANLDKLIADSAGSNLSLIITTGSRQSNGTPKILPWSSALSGDASNFRPQKVLADDPAVLIYTSGTTGPPKGALHAHRFLVGHLPSVEMVYERVPAPSDVGWTPADWAWIGGLMDLAMPCLYFGLPLIAHRMRKFDPDEAFSLIRNQSVSISFLPPTALKMMRQTKLPKPLGMRAIASGGESLGTDLLEWGLSELGAPINELYGQTECNLVVSSCMGLGVQRPGAMGCAAPGHRVAILGKDGDELPAGEVGEIAVQKPDPVMFLRYWNQPEKTEEKFNGNWLLTGDLGISDADGYLTFVSRDDDIITSAGYRIGPTEIENCLTGDPDVVLAAAVGVPDAVRTEVVKAYVVPRAGAASIELKRRLVQRVKDRVSPHVAPRLLEFVDELPMTATGKVIRRTLREKGQ